MVEDSGRFDALLQEDRTFPPSDAFKAQANIADPNVYEEALRDPEAFWAKFAEELDWFKKWDTVLDWKPPHAQWFIGGKLNVSYNCLDRHLNTDLRHTSATTPNGL
ncbi:MAG: acetyl-coenzyme A synthetase, partial [Chloroflexi bacterium]|nr:acetyl-coenzyme A synthetase [Chloroflexota bacterium]